MKVTIGGPPGSGTTTVARLVASCFGYKHIYAGEIFREMAAEKDLTLSEFGVLAEKDEQFDREVDNRIRSLAVDNTITEGRMSAFIVNNIDIKIWVDAPLDMRVARITQREELFTQQIHEMTVERQKSEIQRYRKIYGVDIYDLSNYDLVINSGKWDSNGVFAIVKSAITSLERVTRE